MISVRTAMLSEPGGREAKEVGCGWWNQEAHLCAVLADGAGGHQGGQVASRLAVRALLARFSQTPAATAAELAALVRETNRAVLDGRASSPGLAEMYTTIVCLSADLRQGTISWAHCGDSRLYWFRDGRLVERTRDHSLVQALVDAGVLEEEQLRTHPRRSTLQSALGMQEGELTLAAQPGSRPIEGANVFLLCSDGVWEHLSDATLEDLLGRAGSPDYWLAAIGSSIAQAVRPDATHDNYTALAVWLTGALDD